MEKKSTAALTRALMGLACLCVSAISEAGTPYLGTPSAVPGKFEAEDFDKGGEGVGYHDLTSTNTGGRYRPGEGVDIIDSRDSSGGGYVVASYSSGEWLAYTVNVAASGDYDLSMRVANRNAGAAYRIEVDGTTVVPSTAVPPTTNLQKFQWTPPARITLAGGTHVVKVFSERTSFNLNSIQLSAVAAAPAPAPTPTPAPAPAPSPSSGTGAVLVASVAGSGTVTSSGGTQNLACTSAGSRTAACTGYFPAGGPVTLNAAPAAGYTLAGWLSNKGGANEITSCASAAPGPCAFVKTAGTQFVTAVFAPSVGVRPLVLYSDVSSGPVGCAANCDIYRGENNDGIYLSLFGKNFGSSGLGSEVKVYLNNVEVSRYMLLQPSKGRADIQQLTVQVGALDQPASGRSLPVMVVVGGRIAIAQLAFTVNPGRIFFVDNVRGVDTSDTWSGGTFAAPFASVQKKSGATTSFAIAPASTTGAWGRVQAGDFMVLRGTGTAYARQGFGDYFLQALNKSGSLPGTAPACAGCTGSGPITLMGYPGEDVFINGAYESARDTGTVSSADTTRIGEGKGHYLNVVGLRIEGGNHDGAVNVQAGGNNWRVVNNEITAATAVNNSTAKAGGITGNGNGPVGGAGHFWTGNYIHDVFNGPDNGTSAYENHGVYIDGNGSGYEIAYNRIVRIRGGNGVQTYTNDGTFIDNVWIHHNVIQNVGKHALNFGVGTRANVAAWNNIVYDIDRAALRFSSSATTNARIHNNTIWNVNRVNSSAVGAVLSDATLPNGAVDLRNNIVVPVHGPYAVLSNGLPGIVTNNLWYGGSSTNPAFTFSVNSLISDPLFASTASGGEDFHLQASSTAINAGTGGTLAGDDYDAATAVLQQTLRPIGGAIDIGAYER